MIIMKKYKIGDKIKCDCGCGGTFTVKKHHLQESWVKQHGFPTMIKGHYNRGKHPSKETRQKMVDNHADFSGENHPRYGKEVSQETRDKISASLVGKMAGENHPNFGKKFSKKVRKNMSEGQRGKKRSLKTRKRMSISRMGENNGRWRGGYELRRERSTRKRRHLGFEPLNEWSEGLVGHHIDKEHVIFIPEDMHSKYRHALKDKESMKVINELAFAFYSEQFFNNLK